MQLSTKLSGFLLLLLLLGAMRTHLMPSAQASAEIETDACTCLVPGPEAMQAPLPIRITVPNPDTPLPPAAFELGILGARPGEWIDVLATPAQVERLRAAGHLLEAAPPLPRSVPPYFHTYEQLVAGLEQYAALYPEIALLEDFGDAWGKIYAGPEYPSHDLWALKISDHARLDEAEPVIVYVAAQHAREPAGAEIALAIIDSLLTGYGTDPHVTRWVDEHETWVVPLANPDGHWCCRMLDWPAWRKNARDNDHSGDITSPWGNENHWYWPDGVDQNRNFGWAWGGAGASHDPLEELYCGPAPFSEPETEALRALLCRELPAFVIEYHSYGEQVLWPFGYDDSTSAPDELALAQIGEELAARIPRWGGGGDTYDPRNAGELYLASGTATDWEYGWLNAFAYTIETCTQLYAAEEELAHAIAGNVAGALYLQERIDGPGVRGRLTAGGLPVDGTVWVEGLDDPERSLPRHSHPGVGDYYRLLRPGTYDLRFEAPGWPPRRFEDVLVPPDGYVVLDVDWNDPSACPVAGFRPERLAVYPNPASTAGTIHFQLPEMVAPDGVEIVDCQGRVIATLVAPVEPGRGRVLAWRPDRVHPMLSSGLYLARARLRGSTPSAAPITTLTSRFVLLGTRR